ncbi:hypothetical protein [Cytobacillus horneckiae]|uniref:hypothetical protein n=1 Tax=Cytobacillus horneckiae TaxID=549687 RepID=UPI002041AC4C|nr:hypothetical protein [Cytobacillus horneckiae]MCM3176397.1 hypothetical protein [Cytobacillus horneckiae]
MSYVLTAEEYILSLLLLGGAEAASSIKDEVYGEISESELECRLDCAANGLISKGLLTVEQNQEAVEEQFRDFMMGLTNVERVIRCQIATNAGVTTTSLFCNEAFTVQLALYENRIFKLFKEDSEQKLSELMDLSHSMESGEAFSIKESLFEKVIDKFLGSEELTKEESEWFTPDFLEALSGKQGKLNSLYDYRLGQQVAIGSLLYITGKEHTWFIESSGDTLTIAPFSFRALFE